MLGTLGAEQEPSGRRRGSCGGAAAVASSNDLKSLLPGKCSDADADGLVQVQVQVQRAASCGTSGA